MSLKILSLATFLQEMVACTVYEVLLNQNEHVSGFMRAIN